MGNNEKRVTVSYPDHHNVFTQRIWNMFTTKCDVDLNVVCPYGKIGVHQLILKLFIPTLTNRFTWTPNSNRESRCGLLEMSVLDLGLVMDEEEDLELFIEFVYRGTIDVTNEQMESLRRITSKFSVPLQVDSDINETDDPEKVCDQSSINSETVMSSSVNKRKGKPTEVEPNIHSSGIDENETNVSTKRTLSPHRYLFRHSRKKNIQKQTPVCRKESNDTDVGAADLNSSRFLNDQDGAACSDSSSKEKRSRANVEKTNPATSRQQSSETGADGPQATGTKNTAEYRKEWRQQRPLQTCSHCDFKTRDKRLLLFHLNAKHDPGVFVFRCDACGRMFQKAESLKRHAETHADDRDVYRCGRCDYSSAKKVNYYRHLLEYHKVKADGDPAEDRFRCADCDFTCTYKSRLVRHVHSKHSQKKPFQCDQCPYSTTRREHVAAHVRSVHLLARDYVCDRCGKRLASAGTLLKHKITHTGEKPYKCHLCGKSYTQNNKLKTHLELHSSPNEKSYFCHLCGHATRRKDNLQEHLKRIHKTTFPNEDPDTKNRL